MKNVLHAIVCFLSMFTTANVFASPLNAGYAKMDTFLDKEDVTILITDSGLGGIAVCADIEERLHREHPFRSVNIVFCNALPESDYGYNMMSTPQEKIKIFSDALTGMTKWYSPDIIMIACNTLSVLYDQTDYSHTATVPVISIVDIGVGMMTDALNTDTTSSVIIFGTETTIEADSHRSLLLKNGIVANKIVTQACPDLAGEIQSDPASDAVGTMIEFAAGDAIEKLRVHSGSVYAALCCTHYGYVAQLFQRALNSLSNRKTSVIDPTRFMGNVVFPEKLLKRFSATTIRVHVASRAAMTPGETESIGALVSGRSKETANALRNFEMKKDLFYFQRK